MAMTGFICHDDYYDRLKRLTDEEVGRLFRNLMLYHAGRTDEMQEFVDSEGIAFDFIVTDIDRMEQKNEANSQNGSKGGRPRKPTEANESEEKPIKANESEQNPTKANESEEKRTKAYKDKDKDKEIKKETLLTESKEKSSRFSPPSLEEVAAYCQERKNGVSAERFVDFYSSKGWRVGNQPMKDWQAAVRTWEQRERAAPAQKPAKQVVAQQYEQRDYSGESQTMDDVLDWLSGRAK